jgi:hypothetical protein
MEMVFYFMKKVIINFVKEILKMVFLYMGYHMILKGKYYIKEILKIISQKKVKIFNNMN